MQHQYWVTKKSVLRKFGGKEDECIVSSDAELDAKLELFKSINDGCTQLQRVIDLYQEKLCHLAQEENALGRYLKEYGKNDKNVCAGQIMITGGKALAYTGHQRLTVRPPLIRLHHEVETFRSRAVTDTRETVSAMEKARTEYRAALSWMKSVSLQLDPDTGHGLERFRKAQSYVKTTKTKFDNLTLVCLQKVDLLAAARCNMFSHSLVPYQRAVEIFSTKAAETLTIAVGKLDHGQPYEFNTVAEITTSLEIDKDKNTFFNAGYTDNITLKQRESIKPPVSGNNSESTDSSNLLGENFSVLEIAQETHSNVDGSKPSFGLLDHNWTTNSEFFEGDFMPSKLIQNGALNFTESRIIFDGKEDGRRNKTVNENNSHVSWLSLFAELDPLANPPVENNIVDNRV